MRHEVTKGQMINQLQFIQAELDDLIKDAPEGLRPEDAKVAVAQFRTEKRIVNAIAKVVKDNV